MFVFGTMLYTILDGQEIETFLRQQTRKYINLSYGDEQVHNMHSLRFTHSRIYATNKKIHTRIIWNTSLNDFFYAMLTV